MTRFLRNAFIAVAIGGFVGGFTVATPVPAHADVHLDAQKYKYICPMGHEESDKPGNCSECGMKLKKVAADE